MNLTDLAVSGPLLLAALLAATAGAVSFASPCCLPLVPGYLAYLAGLVSAHAPPVDGTGQRTSDRWRVAGAALLFVLGFTVVFAAGTMAVLGVFRGLFANEQLLPPHRGVGTLPLGWVRHHARRVQQFGGLLLILIGVALVSGLWGEVIGWLRGPIAGFTIPI